MKAAWFVPFAAAAALAQTPVSVTREGAYWVSMISDTISEPATRLRISSLGPIAVHGTGGRAVSYVAKRKVKAKTESDARRLFAEFHLKKKISGEELLILAGHPDRAAATVELEFQSPRLYRKHYLETQSGVVQAYNLDGELEVETGGGRVLLDGIGGNVGVRTGGGEVKIKKIRGALRCLSGGGNIRAESIGGEAFFETVGGEIFIGKVQGPVEAVTAGGNIHVDKAASSVRANTSGGLIDIAYAGGSVFAGNAAGCIKVSAAKGVRLESVAGPIQLRGVSGPLNVSAVTGNIVTELGPDSRLEDSYLNTGSGDVTVYIPSNLGVTVRARNESSGKLRRIVSDFPEVRAQLAGLRQSGPLLAEGEINGGGPTLRILAAGGTIYLRRQRENR